MRTALLLLTIAVPLANAAPQLPPKEENIAVGFEFYWNAQLVRVVDRYRTVDRFGGESEELFYLVGIHEELYQKFVTRQEIAKQLKVNRANQR